MITVICEKLPRVVTIPNLEASPPNSAAPPDLLHLTVILVVTFHEKLCFVHSSIARRLQFVVTVTEATKLLSKLRRKSGVRGT